MPNPNRRRGKHRTRTATTRSLANDTPGTVRVVDRRPQPEPVPEPEPDGPDLTLVIIAAILGGLVSSATTVLALLLAGGI
jgi:uncharacterized protein involved in exopolysaccharide biosynthesis